MPPGEGAYPPPLMQGREALEAAYREAVYEVEWPAQTARFRIGDELAAGTPRFGLITGFNPGACRPSGGANEAANRRLESALRARGWPYRPGRGMDRDGGHVEPSFAVFDAGREEVRELAREFGQAAIAWYDGRVVELAWCDAD